MSTHRLFTLLIVLVLAGFAAFTIREAVATSVILQDATAAEPQKLLTQYDAAEASAYRWQAIANFYQELETQAQAGAHLPSTGARLQKSLTEYDAAEASAYRWQAFADYYQKHGVQGQIQP